MKKISPPTAVFIVAILIIMICFAIINYGISEVMNTYDKGVKSFSMMIDKKVILEKDTLQVVDYSIWNGTYTLSNGKYVSKEYVKRHLVEIKQPDSIKNN
jgi:hypothetical protein